MHDVANSSSLQSTVSFHGELTQRQFSQVQRLLLPLWARAYFLAPACVFVFISVGVGWPAVFTDPLAAFPYLLFGLMVLLATALITWFQRKKAWQTNTRLHGQVSGKLTADGLEWNTLTTTAKFPWSNLTSVKESEDLVLIFYAPRCAFYFPRSFFATEDTWRSFKKLLASHVTARGAAS